MLAKDIIYGERAPFMCQISRMFERVLLEFRSRNSDIAYVIVDGYNLMY
jgi:hypothetical protein